MQLFRSNVLDSFLEVCHTFTSVQAIYLATITAWTAAKPNSYPVALTIVLEGFITVLVEVRVIIAFRLDLELELSKLDTHADTM